MAPDDFGRQRLVSLWESGAEKVMQLIKHERICVGPVLPGDRREPKQPRETLRGRVLINGEQHPWLNRRLSGCELTCTNDEQGREGQSRSYGPQDVTRETHAA